MAETAQEPRSREASRKVSEEGRGGARQAARERESGRWEGGARRGEAESARGSPPTRTYATGSAPGAAPLPRVVMVSGAARTALRSEVVKAVATGDESAVGGVREAPVPRVPLVRAPSITGRPVSRGAGPVSESLGEASAEPRAVPIQPRVRAGDVTPVATVRAPLVVEGRLSAGPGPAVVPRAPQVSVPSIRGRLTLLRDVHLPVAVKEPEGPPEGAETEAVEGTEEAAEPGGAHPPSSILTMLFGEGADGLLRVSPDRPTIVVAVKLPGEEYVGTLLSMLREIYRMKAGGLPKGRVAGTAIEKHVVEGEPVTEGIKVVDDSEAGFLEFFGASTLDRVDPKRLADRLTELSVQGLRFLVFHVDESKANTLLAYLSSVRHRIAPIKVVVVRPRRLPPELKRELARISWGFVEPGEPVAGDTIDQHFKRREEEFNELLERVASERRCARRVRASKRGPESGLHYQLKAFLVCYLLGKLKVPEEDVETEVVLPAGGEVVPDVYVRSRRLAIEVETFYGTGQSPWHKLGETVEKYARSGVAGEVWIVIPPLQAALYLRDLIGEARELRRRGYGFVKLYTVDLRRGELVPVELVPRRLGRQLTKLGVGSPRSS